MIFLQVAAAVLTVFGAYSVIRLVGELFFTPKSITAAVLVTSHADLEELGFLLREADRHSLRTRGHPPVVLIDRALMRSEPAGGTDCAGCPGCIPDAARLLASRGTRWYPVDLTGGADNKMEHND